MGRPAKASPEELARACKKLHADGNLTIHSLRHELGGGGAEYLTRGLREWRQQQHEEARVPMEQKVSMTLRIALTDELQRVRDEAMQEVHSLYAEDRAHLDFCLGEIRRLEQEQTLLDASVVAAEATAEGLRTQAVASMKEARDRAQEQERRADGLATRMADLQQVHREQAAECSVARQQRDQAVRELSQERATHARTRENLDKTLTARSAEVLEHARLEERCVQQQEMLRYIRSDLEVKCVNLKEACEQVVQLQSENQKLSGASARAQATLDEMRRAGRPRFVLKQAAWANSSKPKTSSA